MARIDTADLISISEATKRGVSALVREAEAGRQQVVVRNSKPVAAVVGKNRLGQPAGMKHQALPGIRLVTPRDVIAGKWISLPQCTLWQ